ncbi:hypothetical protein [Sagittula sp. SSi028]|uniref:hypothetical protein n=1 Tax=Sagittula sp. SSi028 TaxID=3400636 RepID=UPI003AF6D194
MPVLAIALSVGLFLGVEKPGTATGNFASWERRRHSLIITGVGVGARWKWRMGPGWMIYMMR